MSLACPTWRSGSPRRRPTCQAQWESTQPWSPSPAPQIGRPPCRSPCRSSRPTSSTQHGEPPGPPCRHTQSSRTRSLSPASPHAPSYGAWPRRYGTQARGASSSTRWTRSRGSSTCGGRTSSATRSSSRTRSSACMVVGSASRFGSGGWVASRHTCTGRAARPRKSARPPPALAAPTLPTPATLPTPRLSASPSARTRGSTPLQPGPPAPRPAGQGWSCWRGGRVRWHALLASPRSGGSW
mmetsp:Transcript_4120/g.13574  ORF Transcript_4120/g.13574 Transcript_4120/m.13574 type:complete len:240 (-) Transcript_4120:1455-2174(-)